MRRVASPTALSAVIAGLDPAIHITMDARVKRGHDLEDANTTEQGDHHHRKP
jgi:hypothetical protein